MNGPWGSFWQSVSAASLLTSVVAVLKMYTLGIEHGEQLKRVSDEVASERRRNDAQDARHIAAEVTLARIDANVVELLQIKRNEQQRGHSGG